MLKLSTEGTVPHMCDCLSSIHTVMLSKYKYTSQATEWVLSLWQFSFYISPVHKPFCHTKGRNLWSYRSTSPTCLHGAHKITLPLPFPLPPLTPTLLLLLLLLLLGAHGDIVGFGTTRLWVQFSMVSLDFFINIIVLAALWLWGRLKPLTGIFPGG
jgi:hypothetical protein